MPDYICANIFPVPVAQAQHFLDIHQRAGARYKQLGAVSSEILKLADGAPKYGCQGIAAAVQLHADETCFMVLDRFESENCCARVTEKAEVDSELSILFDELQDIIDLSRAIRIEFLAQE